MMPILSAQKVSVSIEDKQILTDVSIEVEQGEIVSIIGPNGSGKTTLLRAISKSAKLNGGCVELCGKDIGAMSAREIARSMAVLSQAHECAGDLLVRDLVSYGRFAHKRMFGRSTNEDKEVVDWALERTRMTALQFRKTGTLSGGELQRAWIAMAIAQKPKMFLLDEPTTYLDINHQLQLMDLVRDLNQSDGLTVIMVLHDLNQAARFSSRLIVMKDGRLACEGKPDDIMTEEILGNVFRVRGEISRERSTGTPVFMPQQAV